MQLNVPVKPVLLWLLGVIVGIGLVVGPRHVHWPAPKPDVKPAPRPFPSTDRERPSFPATWLFRGPSIA